MKKTISRSFETLLSRGVDTVYPSREALAAILTSGKKLRIYHGIDPTGPLLHVGHLVPLRKLEQFRKEGHAAILLIGDFTATIGDPSGKKTARHALTESAVGDNMKTYLAQAGRILNFTDKKNPVEVRYNSEWWKKMSAADFLRLGSDISAWRLLERDMFVQRHTRGEEVTYTELGYPLLQGYDSVALEADLEIGGTDQTFNMLMGRKLVATRIKKEKFVLTTPLFTDAHGRKIGKTEGNVIAIAGDPNDLFGKLMTLADEAIVTGFTLLTDMPAQEIKKIEARLRNGANPRDIKTRLAYEIVASLHGAPAAGAAEAEFVRVFRADEMPTAISLVRAGQRVMPIVELLRTAKLASSKSDARRLIEGKGIKIDGKTIDDIHETVSIASEGIVIQKGKRHFIRIVP